MRHETNKHCGRVEIIASCFEIDTLLACKRKRAAANSLLGVVVCARQNANFCRFSFQDHNNDHLV